MRGNLSEGKTKSKEDFSITETNKSAKAISDEVSSVVLGKESTIEMLMAGVLANGNILFEDFPGLAKTLMSNTLADALGCEFKRIQFTPDLLPADITGSYFFDPEKNIISAIHTGWKGAYKKIIYKTIYQLKKEGSNIKDLIVVIGPCISKQN